jgi:large subunit ribosomal protein L33
MAKKDQRLLLGMVCTVCKSTNYVTKRNKINTPEKIRLSKYCRRCKKHTEHKETSKLD